MEMAENEEDFFEGNRAFHFSIYKAARMPVLLEFIETIWARISPYMHMYISVMLDYEAAAIFHKGMLEGIRSRDSKEVTRWLSCDLNRAARISLDRLKGRERSAGSEGSGVGHENGGSAGASTD